MACGGILPENRSQVLLIWSWSDVFDSNPHLT
jgi:hypothetical protein